jgi:hypothetical protein
MMKIQILIFLIIAVLGAPAAKAVARFEEMQLSVANSFACILDYAGVQCWGAVGEWLNVPPLKNPRQVSAGSRRACAIDDNGVQCWGLNRDGLKLNQKNVPAFKNPRQISVGGNHICALDDNSMQCWSDYGLLAIPTLQNPSQISAGYEHTCAIDDNGVQCWVSSEYGGKFIKQESPQLKNPRQISAGKDHTCALDDNGVQCWFLNKDALDDSVPVNAPKKVYSELVPPLQNPREVSAGYNYSCAIDDNGIQCWIAEREDIQTPRLPANTLALKNPSHLSSGVGIVCAVDGDEVQCLSDGFYAYIKTGYFKEIYFSLEKIQRMSPISHLRYYESLAALEKGLSVYDPSEKYLFYSLLRPAIEQTFTEFQEKIFISRYDKFVLSLTKEIPAVKNIQDVRDSDRNRQIALKHIQAGLAVAFEFFSPADKNAIQPITQLIGTAYSSPGDANVKAVLQVLEEKHPTIDSLKNSERSAFLVDVIDLAASWLKARVP